MLVRYADYKKNDTVDHHMKHLTPFFKHTFMSQINNGLIREYTAHRTSQKVTRGERKGSRLVSPSTVRRELDTLSAAFGFAKREGYISESPYIEKPQAAPPRERWLTIEEQGKLKAACNTPHLKVFVEISLASGARPSSVLDLKWFQVDLEARLIHFNPEGRTQTKKHRPTVRINDYLLPILDTLRTDTKSEYVISRKNGKRVESIKKGFRDACKRAGIAGATPYTLRHTAITMLIRGGISLAQAGQLAGHKEPRTTARYAKHDPSFTQAATDILATGAVLAHNSTENSKKEQKPSKRKAKIQ